MIRSEFKVIFWIVVLVAAASLYHNNKQLRHKAAHYKEQAEVLELTLDRDRKALEGYQKAHQRDTQELMVLDLKIKELQDYVSQAEDSGAECLAPHDTERLRRLWD